MSRKSTGRKSSWWGRLWDIDPAGRPSTRDVQARGRKLGMEPLEGRAMLSGTPGALIKGVVFNDLNGTGISTGSPGVNNVSLNLWRDGGNGAYQGSSPGSDDSLISSAVTDPAGSYSFQNLAAGTYFVQEVVPAGYQLSAGGSAIRTVVVTSTAAQGRTGLTIDSFTTTQQNVASSLTVSTSASNLAAPEALGGNRDFQSQLTSTFGSVELYANAFNQQALEFNLSATAVGTGTVTWDGATSPGTLNPTGLNHVDLTSSGTASGFWLNIGSDRDSASLTIKVYKDANNWSTASTTIPYTAGAATQPLFVPFSSFASGSGATGAGAFNDVGAVQLILNGASGAHAQIKSFTTIGPTVLDASFANYLPATVGSSAFWDLNGDGLRGTNDPAAANVPVQLWQNNTLVASSTTDSQGKYLFTGVAPGTYSVKFVAGAGIKYTQQFVGTDPTINSGVDPNTGATPTFNLQSGQSDLTRNAGLLPVDLLVTKVVDNPTPVVGNNVRFTINLMNAANVSQASGVILTDLLPAGLTYVSSTVGQGTYNPGTGVWNVGTLASGSATSLVIVATVTTAGVKTNTAQVTGTNEVDRAPLANLTSSATVTPIQQLDLKVTKTVDNPTPNVGSTVTFTVGLSDLGPAAATNVVVTDLLPAGLTFVSSTPSQGSYDPATGAWTVGSVTVGSAPLTLQIRAVVATPGAKTNTAQLTSVDQPDTNSSNNQASATVTPQQSDLVLTKAANNLLPNVGDTVTFTVTVANTGVDTATNTRVTDVLPPGLTYVSSTATQGSYNPTTGIWTVGTVTVGATPARLTVVTTVANGGSKDNTATVTADQYDPNLLNNTQTVTVTPAAQIGNYVFWDLNRDGIQNTGDTPVANVTVQLLQNSTVVATTTTNAQGKYLFTSVAPGTYSVHFVTPHGETFTAEGVGTDPALDSDVDPTTGSTSTFTVVSGQSDLTQDAGLLPVGLDVTKDVDFAIPLVGDQVVFTVSVANATNSSQATGVTLSDLLPAGLTFVSSTATQGTYNSATGVWLVGNIASGGTAELDVTARVDTSNVTTNVATITAVQQPDPNATPAKYTASATVTPRKPVAPPPPQDPPPLDQPSKYWLIMTWW